MRISVVLTLAATLALGSAKNINMSCGFAADRSGMIQTPYCCRDFKPVRNNPKSSESLDCMPLS